MAHGFSTRRLCSAYSSERGGALLEWLVAVPLVLLVGLGALQWALVIQAKQALGFGAAQAVREAAREFGRGDAINSGFAGGLQPFWLQPTGSQALARLEQGIQAGWITWRRVHPAPAVFTDFAQPARTRAGDLINADTEIPNDNLSFRSSAPGRASGVSVQSANRLSVEFSYGITLPVPLIGALIVRVMEIVDGCRAADRLTLVTINLGRPAQLKRRMWTCGIYRAPAIIGGPPVWRLPVRVRAERWMQSPLRQSSATNSASKDGSGTVSISFGTAAQINGPDVLSALQPGPSTSNQTAPDDRTGRGERVSTIVGTPAHSPDRRAGDRSNDTAVQVPGMGQPGSTLDRLTGPNPGNVNHPGQCHGTDA